MTDTPAPDPVEVTQVRPRSILRDRNFLRFWTGETVSMLGSTISGFALAIVAVRSLNATPGQMGLIRISAEVPALVIGLVVGVWVDRLRKRRLLVTLDLCAAAAVGSITVAHLLGALSIWYLFALAVVWGILDTFWGPAWNSFLPSVVRNERLVDANSKLALSGSATGVVGPGLAGFLVDVFSAPIALAADAASFVFSAFCVSGVRTLEGRGEIEDQGDARLPIRRRIGEGLRLAFLDPLQRAITAPATILALIDALSLAVYVIFALRVVGMPAWALGAVFMSGAAGFLVGSVVAPRIERRFGAGRAALLGLGLVGASPFTMVLADVEHPLWLNVAFLGFPGVLGGFGGMIQHVMLSSLRQAHTPGRLIGRVYSSLGVLLAIAGIVGAGLGGWLGETIGPRPTILVAALGYTVPFLWSLFTPLRTATTSPPGAAAGTG